MTKTVVATLLAAGACLWAVVWWFYDNLLFNTVLAWLNAHGYPEARLSANLPPFLVTAATVWVIYALARYQIRMANTTLQRAIPDESVCSAIDYIVNDANTKLRSPSDLRPESSGSFPPGTKISVVGVEHVDAVRKPEHWNAFQLDLRACLNETIQAPQTRYPGLEVPLEARYTALRLCHSQIEQVFGRKPIWARLIGFVRRQPRIEYHAGERE